MKNRWKTVLAWLMSIAGFASCEGGADIPSDDGFLNNMMCMYGTPYADYDVNITITDENGMPIRGIEVHESYPGGKVIATSDMGGHVKASLEHNSFCSLYLTDVDGEANGGEFNDAATSERDLQLKQVKKGDKSWYQGRFEATGVIKMTRKKSE